MPLESMYLTAPRFNRIFLLPPATKLRIAPRSAAALSPMRTSPLKSRIATSPAWRCLISNPAIAETSLVYTQKCSTRDRHRACKNSFEVAERVSFGVVSIEDRQQLRDRKQVSQLFCQAEQFKLSALLINRSIAGHQFADAARIDVAHACQIQQNVFLSFFQQATDGAAQSHATLADRDAAVHVENGHIAGLALADVEFCHDPGFSSVNFRISSLIAP